MPAEVTIEDVWTLLTKTNEKLDWLVAQVKYGNVKDEALSGREVDLIDHVGMLDAWAALAERGLPINMLSRPAHSVLSRDTLSIDLLLENDTTAIVMMVRSQTELEPSSVDEHIETLDRFKAGFSRYRDRRVLGAIVGIDVPAAVVGYAASHGLFVLAPRGATLAILNDDRFEPRIW